MAQLPEKVSAGRQISHREELAIWYDPPPTTPDWVFRWLIGGLAAAMLLVAGAGLVLGGETARNPERHALSPSRETAALMAKTRSEIAAGRLTPAQVTEQARMAIARGAPREQVIERVRQIGGDPRGL